MNEAGAIGAISLQFFRQCSGYLWEAKGLSGIKIRAADAKEVGVGNPAEETCCYPNTAMLQFGNGLSTTYSGIAIYATRRAICIYFIDIPRGAAAIS